MTSLRAKILSKQGGDSDHSSPDSTTSRCTHPPKKAASKAKDNTTAPNDLRISPAAKKAASKAKDRRSYGRPTGPTGIIGKHTPPARTHQHQGWPYQRPPSSSMATSNPRMDQVLMTQSSPQHTEEPDLSASDSAENVEVNQTTEATSDEFSTTAVTSSSEDSDFIPVSHKRQRTTSAASSAHGNEDAGEASSANSKDYCGTFRIITMDYSSEMEVLALLFCEHPKLECARRQINNRSVLLLTKTKLAYDILSATTRLSGKSVKFELMGEKPSLRTDVLHHVPPFISEHPKLECARRQINNRSVLLLTKTKLAYYILSATTRLSGKSVKFELMGEKTSLRTGVLHHVPPFISEQAILSMEKIISASRILRWDPTSQQKVPTEMIKFQYDGPLPATIRLGVCGKFKVRPYVPSPTRCYKCQKFGHVATTCMAKAARCRLCAGAHLTEQCQIQRNSGQIVTLKCANCGEAHPASSGLCQNMRDVSQTICAQGQHQNSGQRVSQLQTHGHTKTNLLRCHRAKY